MEGSQRLLVVTLRPRSVTGGQHVIRHKTGQSRKSSGSGLSTQFHKTRVQCTNHLWCPFIGVYRDSEEVVNGLRPFQQSDLRWCSINFMFLRNADESDLGVFEGHKETIQVVFDRRHNPDGFYTSNNPMQAMFANKV